MLSSWCEVLCKTSFSHSSFLLPSLPPRLSTCIGVSVCLTDFADDGQGGLDAPPGGGDWFEVDEPRGVGESVLDALEIAEDSVKVCACGFMCFVCVFYSSLNRVCFCYYVWRE